MVMAWLSSLWKVNAEEYAAGSDLQVPLAKDIPFQSLQ